jgi:DNA gyrase inhibitor GyrI
MSENLAAALAVSIRELSPVHVATIDYVPSAEPGDLHDEIHQCFERIQTCVKSLGLEPFTLLQIGIPVLQDGQLLKYEWCVELPLTAQSGAEEAGIQDLPGGPYSILIMQKDPAVIGESIGRFYQEYLPQNHIEMDGLGPTYELYYETTMEYCVPILQRFADAQEAA